MINGLALFLSAVVGQLETPDDATVHCRVTGLFQPDRVQDLERQVAEISTNADQPAPIVSVLSVDYDKADVTLAFDPDAAAFKGKSPEQVRTHVHEQLHHVSRGAFSLFPVSAVDPAALKEEVISVAGLDCKGCAYGAYRAVAPVEGVERAVVSFKDGRVTAWIDPAKTNRAALITALKKSQVDVLEPEALAEPQ